MTVISLCRSWDSRHRGKVSPACEVEGQRVFRFQWQEVAGHIASPPEHDASPSHG